MIDPNAFPDIYAYTDAELIAHAEFVRDDQRTYPVDAAIIDALICRLMSRTVAS